MSSKRSPRRVGHQLVSHDIRVAHGPVRRRRIVYIAGYDPRPPEGAKYDLLKREAARYCKDRPVDFTISDVEHAPDAMSACWTLSLAGEGWRSEAEYLFLRWDDIVARDFARSFPERLLRSLVTLADYLASGTVWRMGRIFHRTLMLWPYPFVALAAIVAAAIAGGFGAGSLLSGFGAGTWLSLAGGVLAAGAIACAGALLTRRTFIQHLADLWCFCRDFAISRRPDMEERCDLFADRILEAVRRDDVDETLLIGHSYGCMMIVEAVARALDRDEQAFETGAPVGVITLGSCIDTSTLHPRAHARKGAVRRVAQSDKLLWAEIQGRQDMINFYLDDPGVAAGLPDDSQRPNPVVRVLTLLEVLGTANYRRFQMNYFRLHYQTICANDRSHPWDYLLTVAGPDSLAERIAFWHWQLRWRDSEYYASVPVPVLSAFHKPWRDLST
ncbi:MAG: hypothetical protein H6878_13415 [Rhodobiaceae bacterium]|nr:hypothetical protein [Rhodobiaceae bacterium]MCC0041834.1 hypothetical protein [Rhodobiaceae bacterium]